MGSAGLIGALAGPPIRVRGRGALGREEAEETGAVVGDFPLPFLTREKLQDTGKQDAPLFNRAYARLDMLVLMLVL